jgi:hypothetical protein
MDFRTAYDKLDGIYYDESSMAGECWALVKARIASLDAQLAAAQERERVLNDDLKFALELAVAYAPNIKDQEWAAELIEQMDSPTPSQEADDEQD